MGKARLPNIRLWAAIILPQCRGFKAVSRSLGGGYQIAQGSPRRTHIWHVELPRVCCTWITRWTIGRRSVKLVRLGRKEDARPCIDIAQSRSATSRGQDENSFGGTRAD